MTAAPEEKPRRLNLLSVGLHQKYRREVRLEDTSRRRVSRPMARNSAHCLLFQESLRTA